MNTNSVIFFENGKSKPIPDECELIIAVWEIVNPENAGQIIRLAHNVGANKVMFINENVNFRESKIRKTAGFSFQQMAWEFITPNDFISLLNKEFQLIVLETCKGAHNIYDTKFPQKAIVLAGSESHGIPWSLIEKSDIQVFIPMPGGCKSMNVSHALSVASFEWYRQVSR